METQHGGTDDEVFKSQAGSQTEFGILSIMAACVCHIHGQGKPVKGCKKYETNKRLSLKENNVKRCRHTQRKKEQETKPREEKKEESASKGKTERRKQGDGGGVRERERECQLLSPGRTSTVSNT